MGKAFQELPDPLSLENFTTFFMTDSDLMKMEEKKAILKYFRILTEEQNEDMMQGDTELSFNVKKNGDVIFDDALENSIDFSSYVILSCEGEKITSNSVGHLTKKEAGNDSDLTEEERNNFNLTEQQSKAVNAENDSEEQTFATNQEQNETADQHWDEVKCCSSQGCHISVDECPLNETNAKCQHNSNDCTNTDCDCVAPIAVKQDDITGDDQSLRKEYKNVHGPEDIVTSVSDSDEGFDPNESVKSSEEHIDLTATSTLEQTEGSHCFKNDDDEEERAGSQVEEDEEEKTDVLSDYSTQPSSPVDKADISIIPAAVAGSPPPGSTFSRAPFSPSSPTDKQIQLPALFSGLRVLRKGVVGPEHDTVAEIKPLSQGARREIFPEKQGDAKVQGGFLDQISQLLSRDKKGEEKEEKENMEVEEDQDGASEKDEREELETEEDAEVTFEYIPKPSVSSAEAAFDAFKAFFTPKPLKKDPAEKLDLEAVRKKIRAEKDVLRALFERTSSKTPEKRDSPECKV